jgi:hypothetical protein
MERPKEQRLLYLCATENCSHRIRRKMATPEATFWFFSFIFHIFTTNVTRALSLEAIKGEVGATSREAIKQVIKQQRIDQTR